MRKSSFVTLVVLAGLVIQIAACEKANVMHRIGAAGPGGGKVFYYSKKGWTMSDTGKICHYLEAASGDMSTSLAWATPDYYYKNIPGTETAIGAGRKNTDLILAEDADAPAAKACRDYRGGGKTDWFLPSKDELDLLYKNKASVGNMGSNWYWSSSQYSNYRGSLAWRQGFGSGDQDGYGKNYAILVRAIRAF